MPATEHLTWRSFVRAALADRGWTQKDLAGRVRMSEANLSTVLRGARRLAPEWAARIAEVLELDEADGRWFAALVDRESDSERAREAADLYLRSRVAARTPHPDQEVVEAQGDWRANVIQELAMCAGFQPDAEWVGRTLEPQIPPDEARAAWETLLRTGLVRPNDRGGFDVVSVRTDPVLATSQTMAGQRLQTSVFELVRRGWSEFRTNERHGGVITMAVSETGADRVLRRLRELEQELVQLALDDPEPRNRVYLLTTQWLPASSYTDGAT